MNLEQASHRDWATRDAAHILENSHTAQVLFCARLTAGSLTRLIDALMAQVIAGEWDVASAEEVRDVLSLVADERAATGKVDAEELRDDVLNTVLPVIEIAILMLQQSVNAED